jgi:PadR family transcriptional regulator PadR
MPKHKNDRLQGTLDLLVLKTLAALGPMHGYGITLHIERVSKDALRLEEGSLYPALHRMTQSGWLRSKWRLRRTTGEHASIRSPPPGEGNWLTKRRIGHN